MIALVKAAAGGSAKLGAISVRFEKKERGGLWAGVGGGGVMFSW